MSVLDRGGIHIETPALGHNICHPNVWPNQHGGKWRTLQFPLWWLQGESQGLTLRQLVQECGKNAVGEED